MLEALHRASAGLGEEDSLPNPPPIGSHALRHRTDATILAALLFCRIILSVLLIQQNSVIFKINAVGYERCLWHPKKGVDVCEKRQSLPVNISARGGGNPLL